MGRILSRGDAQDSTSAICWHGNKASCHLTFLSDGTEPKSTVPRPELGTIWLNTTERNHCGLAANVYRGPATPRELMGVGESITTVWGAAMGGWQGSIYCHPQPPLSWRGVLVPGPRRNVRRHAPSVGSELLYQKQRASFRYCPLTHSKEN